MPYFDNAATTFPKPKRVIDAINDCMANYAANPGRSGHKMALKMDHAIYDTREALAEFIGAPDPLRLIFTYNGTDSLNTAILGFLKEGDHVVTTSMEHNSINRPLFTLEKEGTITLTVVQADDKGRVKAEDIIGAMTDKTSLIAMTHMSNLTGTIQPIEEVAKQKGKAKLLVDAAQSIGVIPVHVQNMGIDLLAFPGHKSLFGPQGTGALYIAEGITLNPIKVGGTGSFSQEILQPDLLPDRFESGTPNGPGIIGLGEGVRFINQTGLENIHAHEMRLMRRFIDGIKDIENIILYGPLDENQGPVLCINFKDVDSAEVAYLLNTEYDIYTRPGLHCAPFAHKTIGTIDQGCVRFSFGYFNTEDEVDIAIQALKNIAAEV